MYRRGAGDAGRAREMQRGAQNAAVTISPGLLTYMHDYTLLLGGLAAGPTLHFARRVGAASNFRRAFPMIASRFHAISTRKERGHAHTTSCAR